MVRRANYLLNQLREYMPCLDMDGYMNIWILKPTNSSRGEGIHICRTLSYILDVVKKNPTRRYVIQKYIGKYALKRMLVTPSDVTLIGLLFKMWI